MLKLVLILFSLSSILFGESFQVKISQCIPDWMHTQIEKDLAYFKDKPISLSELDRIYKDKGQYLQAAKFTIRQCQVFVESDSIHKMHLTRVQRYKDSIALLCKTTGLPDMTFLLSVNDGLNLKEGVPIFAMCKKKSEQIVLLPDYEILGERYQVLKGRNIEKTEFPWQYKKTKLIWRGSTAQLWTPLTEMHLPYLSRVKLCELSQQHPDLIDAKFTIFAQGGENIPYLRKFEGTKVAFEEQLDCKYAILIDGNTCAYSTSGWKLFGNFLIFKPDSNWIQWYYPSLQPWVHYVPVKSNLEDLLEKLGWALTHDDDAQKIAQACRDFALTHLTIEDDLTYLYFVLERYSRLHFVP